jgi:hypothetical protein
VTLGDKSPEPVSFTTESTLGMIIVPTTGVFPDKVYANLRYTTLFTSSFDLRRHVTLGDKSPEPVSFTTESTLGVQWYATSVSLPLLTPFYVSFPFPSVISSGSRQVGILGEKN